MKYRTIVADPPWRYKQTRIVTTAKSERTRPDVASRYQTLSIADICAMPVSELAAENAHLYVWTTNPTIRDVFAVVEAWGFTYRTLITWVKDGTLGLGYYWRGQTEHVAFATRGEAPIEPSRRLRNVFTAPKRGHSVKPQAFQDMVETVSPGPYLELFARTQRLGWDTWGNEALNHIDLASPPC
jgi:N6-adenosine-specific RNA methylase IME4